VLSVRLLTTRVITRCHTVLSVPAATIRGIEGYSGDHVEVQSNNS
jgi:hypothetical protein